jgi:hypothetical protein
MTLCPYASELLPLYPLLPQNDADIFFAHPLPELPVSHQAALPPSFADMKETPPAHIPAFLPALPDAHTYQQTPAYPGHVTEPAKQRQVGGTVHHFSLLQTPVQERFHVCVEFSCA